MAATKKKIATQELSGSQDLLRTLLWSVVALVIIRSFIFESFKIPSSSMVPTLHIGDHIFVSKFDYGLSFPFTKFELIRWSAPKRGDVIVFLYPKDESLHYVKRVVGVPGDKIEFKGRHLFINGNKVAQTSVVDPKELERAFSGEELGGELYQEKLDGRDHWVRFLPEEEAGFTKMKQVDVIPADSFFVVGDNRDQSYDSRSWGYVARENIKGRARVIWLSLQNSSDLNSARKVNWSRSGTIIR